MLYWSCCFTSRSAAFSNPLLMKLTWPRSHSLVIFALDLLCYKEGADASTRGSSGHHCPWSVFLLVWHHCHSCDIAIFELQRIYVSRWHSQITRPRERPQVRVPLFPPSHRLCRTCGVSWSWTSVRAACPPTSRKAQFTKPVVDFLPECTRRRRVMVIRVQLLTSVSLIKHQYLRTRIYDDVAPMSHQR